MKLTHCRSFTLTQHYYFFQVLTNGDPEKVFLEMSHYHFDDEGPLWAARLLPWSSNHAHYANSTKMERNSDDDNGLLHVCHIVLAYHHGISDGHTCNCILRHILTLFNDVLSDNTIDDTKQFSELIDPTNELNLIKEMEDKFKNNPGLLEERTKSFHSRNVKTLIERVYPVTLDIKKETLFVPFIVDSVLSKKFAARCKQEGITFHTGFSSVIDAAIVRLLLSGNINRDCYSISSSHTVNQRSICNVGELAYGCGMGVMEMPPIGTPKDICDKFWLYAKKYHAKFKDQYARRNFIEQHVISHLVGVDLLETMDEVKLPLPNMPYYCTSNMLDVTKCLDDVGEHMYLQYFDRITSIELYPVLFLISFQSFRGQLMYSIAYNVHTMGAEAAHKISEIIFEVLAEVA